MHRKFRCWTGIVLFLALGKLYYMAILNKLQLRPVIKAMICGFARSNHPYRYIEISIESHVFEPLYFFAREFAGQEFF